ncbi:hypothetical protein KOW79_009820 [Hemibagrus wyckioides]|uniref:PABC domain-containing protein n=1 Tax=Hemibagrus wyckioides TaxID=337641 RepID=A0A9D3SP25_9TELE|nr:hypothetical protein KOW79_009820 [Hemibagrus wyckioides]
MAEARRAEAHDYLLPLVEEIHPSNANKITWMLVERENNTEIMNVIRDPELLCTRVDEMDALLKARDAGLKPEILKKLYGNNKKRKKGK